MQRLDLTRYTVTLFAACCITRNKAMMVPVWAAGTTGREGPRIGHGVAPSIV